MLRVLFVSGFWTVFLKIVGPSITLLILLDDADTRLRMHQAHPATLDDAVKLAVEL
jgi:hypothetical protein